jgi:transposase
MVISLSRWPKRRRPNTTGSRTVPPPVLSDRHWLLIADLFPHPPVGPQGGRPRVAPRPCLEGILWVLRTGARWKDLPERYPSPATCWRRHRDWTESGVWEQAWRRLLARLDDAGRVDRSEGMADGTFAPAKKGAPRSATPRRARGPRSC